MLTMPLVHRRFARRFTTGIAVFPLCGVLAVLCGVMAFAPRSALAHAVLVTSTPKAESTVDGPDLKILLKYDSRVDATRSSLALLAPDGKVRDLVMGRQTAPEFLSAQAAGLSKGNYVLRWTALSSDGHITRGEIAFHVR